MFISKSLKMVCRENILCKIFVQLSMARDFFPLFLKCASFTLFLCKKGGLCFFFFFVCASHFLFCSCSCLACLSCSVSSSLFTCLFRCHHLTLLESLQFILCLFFLIILATSLLYIYIFLPPCIKQARPIHSDADIL